MCACVCSSFFPFLFFANVCVVITLCSLCFAGVEGSGELGDPEDALSGLRHPLRRGHDRLEARNHTERRHPGSYGPVVAVVAAVVDVGALLLLFMLSLF